MQSQKPAPSPQPSPNLRGMSVCPVWIYLTENFNRTQGQVSVSMNSDPLNMIHTIQQSTKEGLNKYLDGDFRNFKEQDLKRR